MKKITFITTILLLFTAFTFVSCEIEPVDGSLAVNGGTNNNGGGNTGGGNNGGGNNGGGGTSTGDYWPAAINNVWNFEQGGTQQTVKMIGTDNFNGATYYKFSPQSGALGGNSASGASSWLNKNGGVYTLKMGDTNINVAGMTGVQTGYEMIILKDNIEVNATWSGNYTQTTTYTGIPTSLTTTTTYTGKILEKNATVTVNGVTYNNVIKMNLRQETSMMGSVSIVNTEYCFSKNIGPVKITMYSGSGTFQSNLTSYTVN